MKTVIGKKLDTRFKEFLDTFVGIENIDNLNLTQQQKDKSKADYFAENRQLIIELKSLETDTEHKIERILKPHRSRPEFPDFYGEWQVSKILKNLPDGEAINRKIFDAVASSLKEIYRKANRQIRITKSTFNLPNSQGLLVLLNHKIDVLAPNVILHKLRETANKKNPDKSFQFQEINYILLINEAHFAPTPNNSMGFFILHQPIDNVAEFKHEKFLNNLTKKWTEFNNVSLYQLGEIKSVKELTVFSVAQYNKDQEKLIPRHESWRRYYRRNPYFYSYDEKKMKWIFKIIMEGCANGMLKGATKKQKEDAHFWMETFTHFLEELKNRGMDMKIFAPEMKKLSKEIEILMKSRFPDMNDIW